MTEGRWGPWHMHDGSGQPVPDGAVVEVMTVPPHPPATGGITQAVGVAGVEFVNSWRWTLADRCLRSGLPIDCYRVYQRPEVKAQNRVREMAVAR